MPLARTGSPEVDQLFRCRVADQRYRRFVVHVAVQPGRFVASVPEFVGTDYIFGIMGQMMDFVVAAAIAITNFTVVKA